MTTPTTIGMVKKIGACHPPKTPRADETARSRQTTANNVQSAALIARPRGCQIG